MTSRSAVSHARAIDATGAGLLEALTVAPGASTVFSPASIAMAMHMALCGARGDTAVELARFLRLNGTEAAGEGLRALSAELSAAAQAGGLTFRMPNSMWVQSGMSLRPEFVGSLAGIAAVDVRDADFEHAPEKARLEINRVIAEQTAGKISDLLAPGIIGAFTRLVLTNAVYLNAAWASPFAPSATHEAPFRLDSGQTVTVPMMRATERFGYLRGDGYQAVVLPYAGGRLAMAVLLPDGPVTALADRLKAGGLHGMLSGARRTQVRLALPRFRLEADFRLSDTLRRLGVVRAFSRAADFSGITSEEDLCISEVVHKAYIDVDEKGTEAAAATAVVFRTLSLVMPAEPAVTVTVDRPFLFAITDTATGLPLFLGIQANPSAQ